MKTLSNLASACVLLFAMTGCGGGGDDGPSANGNPPPPVLSVTSLQGIWQGALGASPGGSASAVVLPDGQGWLVLSDAGGIRLIKGNMAVNAGSFSGTGKSYLLGTNTVSDVMLSATDVAAASSLAGAIVSGAVSETYSLAYQGRYDTPATLADFTGAWSGTLGPGTVNWAISASGALSGTRSTGCTYAGQVATRVEAKTVVNVNVTEDCAGALVSLSGIGTLSADKTRASLAMTTSDGAAAVLLALTR